MMYMIHQAGTPILTVEDATRARAAVLSAMQRYTETLHGDEAEAARDAIYQLEITDLETIAREGYHASLPGEVSFQIYVGELEPA